MSGVLTNRKLMEVLFYLKEVKKIEDIGMYMLVEI